MTVSKEVLESLLVNALETLECPESAPLNAASEFLESLLVVVFASIFKKLAPLWFEFEFV